MEQSQLMELVRALKAEEKEQILQFAALPFINNGRMKAQVVPLLRICLNHSKGVAPQEIETKEVYAALFPGKKFVEGPLKKLRVEAHKVVRTFLTTKHYLREGNKFQQELDFSELVRTRGLENRYRLLLAKMKKSQGEIVRKSESDFLHHYLLEYSVHNDESLHNHLKGHLNVPNTVQILEQLFYLNLLALLNRFLLQQKVAKLEVPEIIKAFLDETSAPERCLEASPAIKINFEIYKLLKKGNRDTSDVRSLYTLLLLHEKNLAPSNLQEFYTYLRNLCVLIFNMDPQNEEINFMLHELYKDNLDRGYLHYEGRLHSGTYMEVCNNAILAKDYDWALAFIEKHKQEIIDENETQDYYRLNMANYLFAVGQFEESLSFIPVASRSTTYLLQGMRLEIKARHELGQDMLSYKIENFKQFLHRTSPKLLSDSQRQIHLDFVNLFVQILKSTPGDARRSALLVKRVRENKQVAESRWLLEKAKALNPSEHSSSKAVSK